MKFNIMKNIFQHISISKSEYQNMLNYTPHEKFQYLIDIFEKYSDVEMPNQLSMLNDFFKDLTSNINDDDDDEDDDIESVDNTGFLNTVPDSEHVDLNDAFNSKNRVDILIDNDHILIESNSLKSLRHVIYKFFDMGYVIQRDLETEKIFRKDKLTRYLRVYNIVGINTVICLN